MKKTLILILFILAMEPLLVFPASEDEIVIIVSLENLVANITDTDLKMIYLGEKKQWGDGSVIIPIDLDEKDPLREKFDITILKKSLSSVKYYWIQQIFTGRGVPPLSFSSERLVKEYVASHPGSIGYIHARNLDSSIKAIKITGE